MIKTFQDAVAKYNFNGNNMLKKCKYGVKLAANLLDDSDLCETTHSCSKLGWTLSISTGCS